MDSIVASLPGEVSKWTRCEVCGMQWGAWHSLIGEQELDNNRLIPVEVQHGHGGARLLIPDRRSVPHERFVVSALNMALCLRFRMSGNTSTEGGVEGVVDEEGIELRNWDDHVGLVNEYRMQETPVTDRIIEWYAKLLRALFEDEVLIGENRPGRGSILKVIPSDPWSYDAVAHLTWHALFALEGVDFANHVFMMLGQDRHPGTTLRLAGIPT